MVAASRRPMTWAATWSGIAARVTSPQFRQVARVPAALGDDHRRLGELGHLVRGRLGIAGRRLLGQWGMPGGAGFEEAIDDALEPLRGQSASEMPPVAGLAATAGAGSGP